MQDYYTGEVVGVTVYKNDVVVEREGQPIDGREVERGVITEFSKRSRQRLAFVASNTCVVFKTMITLTYPKEFPTDGREVKEHLRRFLYVLKKWTRGCDYLWFLEFQARGAPHIHILIDYPLPKCGKAKQAIYFHVSRDWYDIVGSEDSKHLAAGTRVERIRKQDGAAHYAVKYAQKMRQKAVPPLYRSVGRFWGCSERVKPQPLKTIRCTEDDIRGELEGWQYAPGDDRTLYRVLYNQANRFADRPSSPLDKSVG